MTGQGDGREQETCPACAGAMPVHHMGLPLQAAHALHAPQQPPAQEREEDDRVYCDGCDEPHPFDYPCTTPGCPLAWLAQRNREVARTAPPSVADSAGEDERCSGRPSIADEIDALRVEVLRRGGPNWIVGRLHSIYSLTALAASPGVQGGDGEARAVGLRHRVEAVRDGLLAEAGQREKTAMTYPKTRAWAHDYALMRNSAHRQREAAQALTAILDEEAGDGR